MYDRAQTSLRAQVRQSRFKHQGTRGSALNQGKSVKCQVTLRSTVNEPSELQHLTNHQRSQQNSKQSRQQFSLSGSRGGPRALTLTLRCLPSALRGVATSAGRGSWAAPPCRARPLHVQPAARPVSLVPRHAVSQTERLLLCSTAPTSVHLERPPQRISSSERSSTKWSKWALSLIHI